MALIQASFPRDANHVPITGIGLPTSKAITYVAGTTGAVGTTTLFTVSGIVAVRLVASVDDTLTGSGTLEVGTTGATAALLGQVNAALLDTGELWTLTDQATSAQLGDLFVTAEDIFQTIGTDTVDSGTLTYYCLWYPVTNNGNVVAA